MNQYIRTPIVTALSIASLALMSQSALAADGRRGLSLNLVNKSAAVEEAGDSNALPTGQLGLPAVRGDAPFVFKQLLLSGNSVFSSERLGQLAEVFVGKSLTASDLEEIRFQLSKFYVDNGYLNSGAVLSGLDPTTGTASFSIIEGRLVSLKTSGAERLENSYIARYFDVGGEALNQTALQEQFQMLLDDPLIESVKGSILPTGKLGEAELALDIERARPWGASLTYDNHKPVSTGDKEILLSGWTRNLTGYGDYLAVSAIDREKDSDAFQLTYELPMFDNAGKLGFSVVDGDAGVIEASVAALDIASEYKSQSAYLVYPLVHSLRKNIQLGFEVASKESQNTLLGMPWSFSPGENNGRAKVAVARASIEGLWKSESDVLSARAQYSQGLDQWNSTQNDNGRPDSDFSSVQLQAQYARRLNDDGLLLSVKVAAQWTNDALLPLEQLALGGADTVRGYRENELVRDRGVLLSSELRWPLYAKADNRFDVMLTADYGYAENVDDTVAVITDDLGSVGVGVRWSYSDLLEAEVFWAQDLISVPSKSSSNLQDDGIHFRVTVTPF